MQIWILSFPGCQGEHRGAEGCISPGARRQLQALPLLLFLPYHLLQFKGCLTTATSPVPSLCCLHLELFAFVASLESCDQPPQTGCEWRSGGPEQGPRLAWGEDATFQFYMHTPLPLLHPASYWEQGYKTLDGSSIYVLVCQFVLQYLPSSPSTTDISSSIIISGSLCKQRDQQH